MLLLLLLRRISQLLLQLFLAWSVLHLPHQLIDSLIELLYLMVSAPAHTDLLPHVLRLVIDAFQKKVNFKRLLGLRQEINVVALYDNLKVARNAQSNQTILAFELGDEYLNNPTETHTNTIDTSQYCFCPISSKKYIIRCLCSYFGMQTALSICEMPSCAMSEISLLPLLSSLRKPSEPVPEKYFEQ